MAGAKTNSNQSSHAGDAEVASRAELLLHPVRVRIIVTLAWRELTITQMQAALSDVAQRTLYRHVNRLAEAGVIEVARRHYVNGILERVYRLRSEETQPAPRNGRATTSPDEEMRHFTTFLGLVLGYAARFLGHEGVDLADLGYGWQVLDLTDDEFEELSAELGRVNTLINELMRRTADDEGNPERRRRLIVQAVMPVLEERPPAIDRAHEGWRRRGGRFREPPAWAERMRS